jgi:hypothetical protein
MTSKVNGKASSLLVVSSALLLMSASACSGKKHDPDTTDLALDAGPGNLSCVIDEDGDGFGLGCPRGDDCNDSDGTIHADCAPCDQPEEGCKCQDEQPVECIIASLPDENTLLCQTGMRYCRDGAWTSCEGLSSFQVPVERRVERVHASGELGFASQALVGDAGVCSPCRPNCYQVQDSFGQDTLDTNNSSNLTNTPTGGITIDHTTVQTVITATQTCIPNQCTAASDQTICDDDCDGIPNAYDLATGTKPFGTTASSIFLSLKPGGEGAAVLNLQYYVRTADVYFLIDAGDTMADELTALYTDMQTGSFLSSDESCGDLNRDGSTSDEEHFKMDGIAGNIACRVRDVNIGLGWFRDIPFAGYGDTTSFGTSPVRTAGQEVFYEHRVDVGYDVDLLRNTISEVTPDADAEGATPNPSGGLMALHHMATAEEAYFGWATPGLPGYRAGVDAAPEAGTFAKRYGCDDSQWGYPCFRDTAFPIVVMITDAPLHNGPGTTALSQPVYPYANLTGRIGGGTSAGWTDGKPHYLQTPQIYRTTTKTWVDSNDVETDAISVNAFLGGAAPDATMLFTIVGNTRNLTSNVTPSQSLCGLTEDATGPDAFYTFTVPTDTTMTISARGSRFPVLLGVSTSWTDFQNGGSVAGWQDGSTFGLDDLDFSTDTEVATVSQPIPLGVDAYFQDSSVTTAGSFPLDVAGIECYSGANDTNKTIGEDCPDSSGTDGNARACDYGSDMLFKFNVQDGLDLTLDLQDSTANMGIAVYDKEPQLPETRELSGSTKSVTLSSPLNAWRFEDRLDSSGDPNPDYTPGAYRFVGDDGIVQTATDHPSDELLDSSKQAAAGLAKWIPATSFNNYTDPDRCNATFSGSSYGWTFDFSLEQGTDAAGTTYPIAIEAIGGGKRNSVSDSAGGNAVKYAIGIVPRNSIVTPTANVSIDPACEDNSTTTTSNPACAVDISNATAFPSSGGYIRLQNGTFDTTPTFTADIPGNWMGCSGTGYSAPTGYDAVYKITNTTGSAQLADISADFPVTHLSLHTSALASAVYAVPETDPIENVSSTPTVYDGINPASNPASDSTTSGVGYALDTSAGNQNLAVTLDTGYDRAYTVGLPSQTTLSVPPYPASDTSASGNTGFVDATATAVSAATTSTNAEDRVFTSTADYTTADFTATLATQNYLSVTSVTTGSGPTLPPSTNSADPVNLATSTVLDNKVYTITGNTGSSTNSSGDLDIAQSTWTSNCNRTGSGGNKTPDMLVKFSLSTQQIVTLDLAASSGAGSNLRAAIFNSATGGTNMFGAGTCAAPGDTKRALLNAGTYYLAFTSNRSSTDASVNLGTVYLSAEDYSYTSTLVANRKLTFSGSTINARNDVAPHCDGSGSLGASSADRIHLFTVGSSAVTARIATNATTDGIAPSDANVVVGVYTLASNTLGSNLACLNGASKVSSNLSLTANTTYAVVVSSSAASTVSYGVTIDTARVESYSLTNTLLGCSAAGTNNLVGSATCNDNIVFAGSTFGNDDSSIPVASSTGVNGDVIHVFTTPAGYDNLLTITNNGNGNSFAPVAALFATGTPNSASTPLAQLDGTTSVSEGNTGTYDLKNAAVTTYAIVVKGVNGSSGEYNIRVRSGVSTASGETQAAVVLQNASGGRHITLTGTTSNRSTDVDSGTPTGFPAGCTAASPTVGPTGTSTKQRDAIRLFTVFGTAAAQLRLDTSASFGGAVVGLFNYDAVTSTLGAGVAPISGGSNCVSNDTPVSYSLGAAGTTTTYALVVSSNVSGASGSYSVDLSTEETYTHPTALDASLNANHVSFSGDTSGRLPSLGSYADVWQVFTVSPTFDNLVRLKNVGDGSSTFQAAAALYTYSAATASLGSLVAQIGGGTSVSEGATGSYHLSGATATSYAVVIGDSGAGSSRTGAYAFELIAANGGEGEETYSSSPFTLSATTETVLMGSTANRSMDMPIAGCSAGNVAQSDIVHRFKVASDTTVTLTNKVSGGNTNARAILLDSSGLPVVASGTQCMTTTTGTNAAVYALSSAMPYYQLVVTSAAADGAGQYEVHILPSALSASSETRILSVGEFAPDNLSLNVAQIDGTTAGNSADMPRTDWDCAGVGTGSDRDTVVFFTVPNGYDNTLTLSNQDNGEAFAPAMALYSPNGLVTSMTGKTCVSEGSTLGYHVRNTSGAAQTYYAVISNGGALSGDSGGYVLRINGGSALDVGESAALSQISGNIDGEYYQITGDTTNAESTYNLSTLCGAGYNGKQSDLVRSFTVSATQDVTISNLASSFAGATVLVMNSGSTTTMASGWGCIPAGSSTTASLGAGSYDLVVSSKNDNSAGSFAVRIAPDKAETFAFGTFASGTSNNHVTVTGTITSAAQNDVPAFGCSVDAQGDVVHVFNLGTAFDNVVRLKNTSAADTVAQLYTYDNTTRALGAAVLPIPTSSGDGCVGGNGSNETTTYRLSNAVSSTGYYAVVVKAAATSAYSFELIADQSEESTAETYTLATALNGQHVLLNGSTQNRSADVAMSCAYGTPSAKQSDVKHIFRLTSAATVTVENVANASALSAVAALYSCTNSACTSMTLQGSCISEDSEASYTSLPAGYYAVMVSAANGSSSGASYGGDDGAYTLDVRASGSVENFTVGTMNTGTSGRDVHLTNGTTINAGSGAVLGSFFGSSSSKGACVAGTSNSSGGANLTEADVLHTFTMGANANVRIGLDKLSGTNFNPRAALFSSATPSRATVVVPTSGGSGCYSYTTSTATFGDGEEAVYSLTAGTTYTLAVFNGTEGTAGAGTSGATGTYTLDITAPDQLGSAGSIACNYNLASSGPVLSGVSIPTGTSYLVAKSAEATATYTGDFGIDIKRATSIGSSTMLTCASCLTGDPGCIPTGISQAEWVRLETDLPAGDYTAIVRPVDGSSTIQPKILLRDLGYLPKPYNQHEPSSDGYVPACQQDSTGQAGAQHAFTVSPDETSALAPFELKDLPAKDANGNLIDYYMLLRGFTQMTSPPDFKIHLFDGQTTTTAPGSSVSYCSASASDAEITQTFKANLPYKVMVKGLSTDPADQGLYNLTFGGAYTTNTFDASGNVTSTGKGVESTSDVQLVSWNGIDPNSAGTLPNVKTELSSRDVRVIGMNTSSAAESTEIQRELNEVAYGTKAIGWTDPLAFTVTPAGLSSQVVRAVEELSLSLASDVGVKLVRTPDDPNGALDDFEFYVRATMDPIEAGCASVDDETPDDSYGVDTYRSCKPSATPEFEVIFINPRYCPPAPNPDRDPLCETGVESQPVPCKCTSKDPARPECATFDISKGSCGGIGWSMELNLVANSKYIIEKIPVYIIPEAVQGPESTTSYEATGGYWQDFDSNRCGVHEKPDWSALEWQANMPSGAGASLAWDVCTADTVDALASCSSYTRIATVTYNGATTEADCDVANGYWETGLTTPQCQNIVGKTCTADSQCGGGTCVGGTCRWTTLPIDLGAMMTPGTNGAEAIRVRAILKATTDKTAAPEVSNWTTRYWCNPTE